MLEKKKTRLSDLTYIFSRLQKMVIIHLGAPSSMFIRTCSSASPVRGHWINRRVIRGLGDKVNVSPFIFLCFFPLQAKVTHSVWWSQAMTGFRRTLSIRILTLSGTRCSLCKCCTNAKSRTPIHATLFALIQVKIHRSVLIHHRQVVLWSY